MTGPGKNPRSNFDSKSWHRRLANFVGLGLDRKTHWLVSLVSCFRSSCYCCCNAVGAVTAHCKPFTVALGRAATCCDSLSGPRRTLPSAAVASPPKPSPASTTVGSQAVHANYSLARDWNGRALAYLQRPPSQAPRTKGFALILKTLLLRCPSPQTMTRRNGLAGSTAAERPGHTACAANVSLAMCV